MPIMSDINIAHLRTLARISVSDAEAPQLEKDIASVLAYVSTIDDITADATITKHAGAVRNVFRDDVVTTTPGEHTDTLLAEAPIRKGRWLKVKKILQQD